MYDALHTPGTADELNALERIARRFVLGGRGDPRALRWLEPCCGTGRFLRLLARRRARVAGVELDAVVAAFANERLGPRGRTRARAVVGDMCRLDALPFPRGLGPPFDVAFSPHNSIRHCASPADLRRHLAAMAAVLRPRGIYAVGVGLQRPGEAIVGEDVHKARRGGLVVHNVCQYFEAPPAGRAHPRRERIVSFTTVTTGRGAARRRRTIESSYDLLCIDPAMWRAALRSAGMVELAIVDDERGADLPADRTDYAYRVIARSDHRMAGANARFQPRRGS